MRVLCEWVFWVFGCFEFGRDTGMQRVDMTSFWSREALNTRMSTNTEDEYELDWLEPMNVTLS